MSRLTPYWYSLIGLAPIPETDERINVALAFGNGRLVKLDFDARLPRLQGVVSKDHRALYAAILTEVSDLIAKGITLEELNVVLGPQFVIGAPRELQVEFTRQAMRALRTAYLSPMPSRREQDETYLRQALLGLDNYYRNVDPSGASYLRGKSFFLDLYGQALERFITVKVPPIRRMIRADRRDVLLNTLVIRSGIPESVIDSHVARVSRQFYAFSTLDKRIRDLTGREVRRVGLIQPLSPKASKSELELVEWAKEVWDDNAEVLRPKSDEETQQELRKLFEWTRAA